MPYRTPLAGFSKTALAAWGERHLAPDAEVFTDALAAFNALRDAGHPHTVLVADSRRGCLQSSTQPLGEHVCWATSSVLLGGTYHAIFLHQVRPPLPRRSRLALQPPIQLAAILRHAVYTHIHAKHWTEKALRRHSFKSG
jgi:hypothetical protein